MGPPRLLACGWPHHPHDALGAAQFSDYTGSTLKLNIIPLSWCSAMWQCAIQIPGRDVEQDVDDLAGADEHGVLSHEILLACSVAGEDDEAAGPVDVEGVM